MSDFQGKDGNEEAIRAAARVFADYGAFIRRVIHFRVNNPSREDDVFQEFFLRLVSCPVPADVQDIKAYLYRAISNDVFDLTRRREKYERHLKKYVEKSQIPVYSEAPADACIVTEEFNSVFGCLAGWLRPREAQIVTMRYRDHYTIAEIATKLRIPRRTVSRYLSSGLGKLRRTLLAE